jgi:hypothetical protein
MTINPDEFAREKARMHSTMRKTQVESNTYQGESISERRNEMRLPATVTAPYPLRRGPKRLPLTKRISRTERGGYHDGAVQTPATPAIGILRTALMDRRPGSVLQILRSLGRWFSGQVLCGLDPIHMNAGRNSQPLMRVHYAPRLLK